MLRLHEVVGHSVRTWQLVGGQDLTGSATQPARARTHLVTDTGESLWSQRHSRPSTNSPARARTASMGRRRATPGADLMAMATGAAEKACCRSANGLFAPRPAPTLGRSLPAADGLHGGHRSLPGRARRGAVAGDEADDAGGRLRFARSLSSTTRSGWPTMPSCSVAGHLALRIAAGVPNPACRSSRRYVNLMC